MVTSGNPGRNILVRHGKEENIRGKMRLHVCPHDRLRIETSGGGGYGSEKKIRINKRMRF